MQSSSGIENPEHKMDVKNPQLELANFLFASFYFSQGSGALQDKLLIYGYDYYRDVLPEVDHDRLVNDVAIRSLAWVQTGPHKRMNNSADNIKEEVQKRAPTFLDPDEYLRNSLLDQDGSINRWLDMDTAEDIVKRDTVFLEGIVGEDALRDREPGRPDRSVQNRSAYNARFLSHAVFYGLLLNPTGTEGFDNVFRRLHPHIAKSLNDYPKYSLLDHTVFTIHMTARPDDEAVFHTHAAECASCTDTLK